jgi:predicted DNA-binding transcriptional regulator AlpA
VTGRLLTAAELGELLGLSTSTILDRFEAGDLPGFRLFPKTDRRGRPTGPVRFRLAEILEALDGWRVNGPGAGEEVSPTPTAHPTRGVSYEASPTPL